MGDALVCHFIPTVSVVDRSVIDSVEIINLIDCSSEVLLRDEVRSRSDVLKSGILGWCVESVVRDIGDGVVGNEMVRDSSDSDADSLLHQTFLLESVRIDERSDQRSFSLLTERIGICRVEG